MNLPLAVKSFAALSSLGGAAIGGYFATSSIRGNKESEVKKSLETESQQPETLPLQISLKLEDKESFEFKEKQEEEYYEEEKVKASLELGRDLEEGEKMQDFFDEIDEENLGSETFYDSESSTIFVEYFNRKSEEYEEGREKPICERWYAGHNSGNRMSDEDCWNLIDRKNKSNESTVAWLSVDREKAKEVLESYRLIVKEKTVYKERTKSWITGPWLCTLEKSTRKHLISCDYYPNRNENLN